jgi:hypothetical protein
MVSSLQLIFGLAQAMAVYSASIPTAALESRQSTSIASEEAQLASSCFKLKKKTQHGAWNLYYGGSGFVRDDSMDLANVPLSTNYGDWVNPNDVCSVANDINRSCSMFADSYGAKQFSITYTNPTLDNPAQDDSPWSCRIMLADNADPDLFTSHDPDATYVLGWSQD